MAIKGTLRNNTSAEIRVNVVMTDGIYFTNSSSSAQNMVAVQILDFEFGYYTSGNQYYIPLSPQKTEEINLIAFCANFDRDNPSSEQTFRSSAMPPELRAISAKISRYHADHMTTTEVMVKATQIALWRIQDWTREEIELQYEVTDESWELSTVIMNY